MLGDGAGSLKGKASHPGGPWHHLPTLMRFYRHIPLPGWRQGRWRTGAPFPFGGYGPLESITNR